MQIDTNTDHETFMQDARALRIAHEIKMKECKKQLDNLQNEMDSYFNG